MNTYTPTEDLVMEVLAARYRLGEHLWPFSTSIRPTLIRLEQRGLIVTMSGNVEYTLRASLTTAGRDEYLSRTYRAPAPPSFTRAEVIEAYHTALHSSGDSFPEDFARALGHQVVG